MANCPRCNKRWRWDWCEDTYRDDKGEECEVTTELTRFSLLELPVLRCTCDLLLGVATPDGEISGCPVAWQGIDWESKEHSYEKEETNG